jgi:hypothetical protein
MKIYEWVDDHGRGVVTDWPKLQSGHRAKLFAKLDMLVRAEIDSQRRASLPTNTLAGPGYGGEPFIYKLKSRGNVQLRPMICLGPFGLDDWTVLYPSTEKSNELIPPDAPKLAEARRKQILADPNRRRLLVDDNEN